jgi:hypothetical protein
MTSLPTPSVESAAADAPAVDDSGCRWRAIGPSELGSFFLQIQSAVLELEEAHAQGRLAEALAPPSLLPRVGEELVATYAQLETSPPRKLAPLRLELVRSLLSFLGEELVAGEQQAEPQAEPQAGQQIESQAAARVEPSEVDLARCATVHSSEPRIFVSLAGAPEERLRLDQVLAARFWGIGLAFAEPSSAADLAHLVAHAFLDELVRGLRELDLLLERFPPEAQAPQLSLGSSPVQRRFEHLLLDILNEKQRSARRAPLVEVLLESTDLRVRYPDLLKKRGARVQVTQLGDEARHRQQRPGLPKSSRPQELVVLSPWTLARFLLEEGARILPEEVLEAFWSGLPDRQHPLPALAASLQRTLTSALSSPLQSPLGPLVHVPPSLRSIIRAYVRHQAFTSTQLAPPRDPSAKGRSSKAARAPARPADRARATPPVPLVHLQAGTTVEGTVKNVVGYGVFIHLGGADGLLHVSELPPGLTLVRGQSVLVRIEEIDGARIRLSLPR